MHASPQKDSTHARVIHIRTHVYNSSAESSAARSFISFHRILPENRCRAKACDVGAEKTVAASRVGVLFFLVLYIRRSGLDRERILTKRELIR